MIGRVAGIFLERLCRLRVFRAGLWECVSDGASTDTPAARGRLLCSQHCHD
jgi:hypothetical protein